ncbi:hypothetical protein B0J15DRAFT_85404 [Fusarium solani]|uniref:Uncharacterized protein n=1 Tax=Fusarium solani TaxID=169388 RepID=A0A9P9GU22_FUSSL|nr:uncharacterized protein B0J15DRAFT_85404 [Fusarium solani]KAH7244688.1 hypothetical protein B0J15DRAFT_85404 [Fusarium solani]
MRTELGRGIAVTVTVAACRGDGQTVSQSTGYLLSVPRCTVSDCICGYYKNSSGNIAHLISLSRPSPTLFLTKLLVLSEKDEASHFQPPFLARPAPVPASLDGARTDRHTTLFLLMTSTQNKCRLRRTVTDWSPHVIIWTWRGRRQQWLAQALIYLLPEPSSWVKGVASISTGLAPRPRAKPTKTRQET